METALQEEIEHLLFLEQCNVAAEVQKYADFRLPHLEPGSGSTRDNTVPVIVRSDALSMGHYFIIPDGWHSRFPNGLMVVGRSGLTQPILEAGNHGKNMDRLMFPLPYSPDLVYGYVSDNSINYQAARQAVRYTAAKTAATAYAAYHQLGLDKNTRESHLLFYRPAKTR